MDQWIRSRVLQYWWQFINWPILGARQIILPNRYRTLLPKSNTILNWHVVERLGFLVGGRGLWGTAAAVSCISMLAWLQARGSEGCYPRYIHVHVHVDIRLMAPNMWCVRNVQIWRGKLRLGGGTIQGPSCVWNPAIPNRIEHWKCSFENWLPRWHMSIISE